MKNETPDTKAPQLTFIRSLTNYFMDFLETDFHKRRLPKRNIQSRNTNNLLVGLNLNKYPSFNTLAWKAINNVFAKNSPIVIEKGVYRTNIPKNLLDLIEFSVKKITNKQVNLLLTEIADEIEKNVVLHKKEYDIALSSSVDEASIKIRKTLILPLIAYIEKPLENLKLGDENNIYLMEEELTEILVTSIENKVSEIIKFRLAKEEIDIHKQLKEVFDLESIKKSIYSFFEAYKVGDLFSEVYEMERNRSILDKQEFYLYFCDITYEKAKYPIFYIPFTITRQNDVLHLEFDSQVYINKKAIEYISQEYNKEKVKKGNIKSIISRIIYLAQHQNDFKSHIGDILNEIVNFFDLDNSIEIDNANQQVAKSFLVRVSNSCYINLFDKSDEALVNDYEEILQLLSSEDNILSSAFNKLIEDFIHKEPVKIDLEIQQEWNDKEVQDKLVSHSPIPLNEEQLQILSAVKRDDCKYIIVQGPPGTGKSHTITAVVFDAILKNQSVLVLSDKKEALDVVEDKITETMNKVRVDDSFQNPVLRLGKIGNAYAKILSAVSIKSITNNYLAVKKNYKEVEHNIESLKKSLKEDIEAEILTNKDVSIKEIYEFYTLENDLVAKKKPWYLDEMLELTESAVEFEEFRKILLTIKNKLTPGPNQTENYKKLFLLTNFSLSEFNSISKLEKFLDALRELVSTITKIKSVYADGVSVLKKFRMFDSTKIRELNSILIKYRKERNWLVGFYFKKDIINKLDTEFKKNFDYRSDMEPHNELEQLTNALNIYQYGLGLYNLLDNKFNKNFDFIKFLQTVIENEKILLSIDSLTSIVEDLKYINQIISKYPTTSKKHKITSDSLIALTDNELVNMSDLDFDKVIRYISLNHKIGKDFNDIPQLNYGNQQKDLENLLTVQMTQIMDGRVVDFWNKYTGTATALKKIIQNKMKFPRNEFMKLKEAFPCILSGIRDYAEYIPLEPGIFDLVIIDEASQVSVAQAFPALLRAKKVLILGDKKQFSNVKTAQARSDENRKYLNILRSSFIKNISSDTTKLVKLDKFNIKTSILEFFEYISNYNTQLLKHFRGYKEIISYSNRYFYQDSLQVMKIRAKAIDEVIKFTYVKHDGKTELIQNTNLMEVEKIVSELKRIKDSKKILSIGIITPHTNQQKLLVEKINKMEDKDYYFDKLKLKIMTFDTCQGEERDLILYSMVATLEEDHLWGVFIKDLSQVDLEEDGRIKAQRLNVGLSRAKECMHFILSKPIEKFNGSIGDALIHYSSTLNEAKKERSVSEVDAKSKMEPEVMNWFYQTDFWNKYKGSMEFIPQFELGKYLKQLDRTYDHPNYKVDFLLVYKDEAEKEHKIIIEYDGFREHFKDLGDVNAYNYQDYYSDADIYREKVLESYGYKFLRINKFNIGKNPIETLNDRMTTLIKSTGGRNNLINHIHQTVADLQNGSMKECPKCGEVRDASDFKDSSLITGYGRFCKHCKGSIYYSGQEKSTQDENINETEINKSLCPNCSSVMILRTGRYGKFYGCSKFPYCRGTRHLIVN